MLENLEARNKTCQEEVLLQFLSEGPEGVKWELGLAGFALGKWGSSHLDWDLVASSGEEESSSLRKKPKNNLEVNLATVPITAKGEV